MSFASHPAANLQLDYRDGLCSAGAALAVATHLALCPDCAEAPLVPWGGRNLPGVLAANYEGGGQAYAKALGKAVLEDWHAGGRGVRLATLKGVAGIGEAAYLVDVSTGAATHIHGALFLVVLQGVLADGPISFERGAFVDLTEMPLLEPEGAGPRGCICLAICEAA